MRMLRTARIPEHRAVEGAVLVMAISITTVRVGRNSRAVRNRPRKGKEQQMGRGKGRRLRMGKGKGKGRGSEMVMAKVLLNKPQGEMISLVPLLCRYRGNVRGRIGYGGLTRAGILRAGSIAHRVDILR